MLRNYFKIALRNLRRHKTFSFINIAGLSISLALVIIIATYAQFELSVDKFHKNYEQIYKVGKGTTPAPLAEVIKSNLPEIKKAARIESFRTTSVTIRYGDKIMSVKNIIFSDADFFDIFTLPAITGNPQGALNEPMTLVLTESEAKRIFGNEDPIDKIVKMDNQFDLTVKAIIKNIPQNSSMQFSGVVSFISLKKMIGSASFDPFSWGNRNYETFVLFPARFDKTDLVEKIESAIAKNIPPDHKDINTDLYPFSDIYYNQDLSDFNSHGSIEKNFALISVAILVLLIAVINFVNLSTARVSARNKEMGVRKTIGASRYNMMAQFLSESIVISIISMVAAVVIALVSIELFGNWFDFRISLFPDSILVRCMIFLVAAILLGIMSGIYPAFYLTSFKPDSILKGNIYHGKGKASLRKALIIFQFMITTVLIISTIVIYKQMEYVRSKPLGFQKENVLYFPTNNQEIYLKRDVFRNKILQFSFVRDFAYSFAIPGNMGMTWGMPLKYEGKESRVRFHAVPTTSDFIRLMGMKITEGRDFMDKDTSGNVIVNQAFVKTFGLKEPLNASFPGWGDGKGKIVGVVGDFNFQSLHSQVEPLVFFDEPHGASYGYGLIKMKSTSYVDIKSVVNNLKSVWKELAPDFPIEYNFLDESLDMQYKSEERFEEAFLCFSLFAIFIACLGLFGLTAYTVEQRTKEISIRKILGATVAGITFMLSKQFVILVLLSNIIAWPIAYYVTNNWLKDFAYRINIDLWIFLASGAMALMIALLTVSAHAIRAATANPVESLRYE